MPPDGYICWDRSFPGAVWFSDTDASSGAVVCKPRDQVEFVGQVTAAVVRAWRLIVGLPVPP